ncbi:sugar ABC transporter permease [Pseudomonas amygdali pv. eriobotryae]|uniref:multiple monosaccharide ABC transporter permease n=1 Tax=Pseudomonas amygdali TaxID=47877 RepID=UPI0006B89BAF|nr:multiple monosaccharide ABC transporter permease [Pseudomonas amygdali]KPB68071.1 ABC-type xylose transport system [Pseudomonas amygdali pv. myricae]KPX88861.1 ABC-type xylose transport system, permease component [Pseudomonas amygdali pv. myricae]KWS55984.1 ABC transporter permease [Pseudomonas amygdali pv. myricae]RMT42235.1 ABC-type xylose transport system, permease component [Pseudomonas amygdali pv. myricae]RMU97336.1 ABC-type xylose transport system, permease component [Pseudomonas amy
MSEVSLPHSSQPAAMASFKRGAREYGLLASLIVIMIFFQVATDGALMQPLNLTNLLLQNSYIVVMALGMLMVIVCGHIDLSVGSVVGVIGSIAAVLMVQYNMDFFSVTVICLIAGGLIGAAQGYWVAIWRMPSFIVTLAGMLIFRGATIAISQGQSIGPFPPSFTALSSGFIPELFANDSLRLTSLLLGAAVAALFCVVEYRSRRRTVRSGSVVAPLAVFVLKNGVVTALILYFCYLLSTYRGIPTVMVIMSVLIGVYTFVMNRTVIGRWVYAVGGNLKASKLSGINASQVTFFAFVNMGVLAAVAGLIFVARLNSATPRGGTGFELDVIAAVFIGGASASGGVGKVVGVVIGAFIMGVLNNGMSIMGIGIDYQQMIKGAVLLAAVFVDVYQKNKG